MSKKGMENIDDLQAKISFALLVISPIKLLSRARELGLSLTATTLSSWRQGKNLPTRTKLEQFCTLCNLEFADMFASLDEFMNLFCTRNHVSPREKALYIRKMEEEQSPALPLHSLKGQSPELTRRLYEKLHGTYICYNSTLDNMNVISKTLICIESERHPFLTLSAYGPRGDGAVNYTGFLFPSRSNLQVVMEASTREHNDFASMKLNNPAGMATEVHFLHGILLATAEDSSTYPAACRVFWERINQETSLQAGMKLLKRPVPAYCLSLIDNTVRSTPGDYVLSSTALNRADVEKLKASI